MTCQQNERLINHSIKKKDPNNRFIMRNWSNKIRASFLNILKIKKFCKIMSLKAWKSMLMHNYQNFYSILSLASAYIWFYLLELLRIYDIDQGINSEMRKEFLVFVGSLYLLLLLLRMVTNLCLRLELWRY